MPTRDKNLVAAPRLAPLRWLTDMANIGSCELQSRLRQTLTGSALPMALGCANSATVALIAYFRTGSSIFLWLALLDVLVLCIRWAATSPLLRPWYADLVLLCGVSWAATTATTTLLISLGDDLDLIILVTASAFGSCAGIIAHNFAAPRYALLQVIMIDVAFKVAFALRSPLFIPLLSVQAVIFVVVVRWIMRRQRNTTVRAIRAEIESRIQAFNDPLTGLLNRRGFQARADEMMTSKTPLTLFYLDLDGFKAVNDQMGHAVGDELLRQIAQRLRDCLPETTICRLGGDEFLILTPGMDRRLAQSTAARLIHAISTPYLIAETIAKVGVSIGISTVEAENSDLIAATALADRALYQAKASGKGHYILADDVAGETCGANANVLNHAFGADI